MDPQSSGGYPITRLMRYLREQAALPPEQRDPPAPEPTPEEIAARRADLARRIDEDIAAPMPPRVADDGVIEIPDAMRSALRGMGWEVMEGPTDETA